MATKNFTSLDFEALNTAFQEFLQSQSKFSDYNVKGSGLSVLMELLALNTQTNAYYANMIANEMFLDTAVIRESVVSRAKHLNYTPRSTRSARATVDITFNTIQGPGETSPEYIQATTDDQLYTIIDEKTYYFHLASGLTVFPNSSGEYIAEGVELIEGKKLKHQWTVNLNAVPEQRFIIPNANIDTTTLVVRVKKSANESEEFIYTLNDDINILDNNSRVYFLQETADKKYEVIFGDGVIGKAIENGNIIKLTYQVSSGEIANDAFNFAITSNLGNYSSVTITTTDVASGGADSESIDSIKKLAPLNYSSQSRAVTQTDYETLIKKDIQDAEFVRVWGGEDAVPKQYGKVFIAIKPFNGFAYPADRKQSLLNSIIAKRNIISIEAEIVEPDYIRLSPTINAYYRSSLTSNSSDEVKSDILDAIATFKTEKLNGFDSDFKYSQFLRAIDDANDSIVKNSTKVKLKYRMTPVFNNPNKVEILLNNALDQGDASNNISSINSTDFIYRGIKTYIGDDGKGILYYYRYSGDKKVIIKNNIGSVSYDTGTIVIDAFDIQSISDNKTYVDVYADLSNYDVASVRNQILLLESEDITLNVIDLDKV